MLIVLKYTKIRSHGDEMKTELTQDIEKALYYYCMDLGALVVEEVSMPEEQGIVDTLACFFKEESFEWRCYELKVTKADFRSKAKLSFIGHYNYFVLPQALYDAVKEEIPAEIGVLVYRPYDNLEEEMWAKGTFIIVKRPVRQELKVAELALTQRFMSSMFREVQKAKRMDYGTSFFSTSQLYKELRKRSLEKDHLSEGNYYQRFVDDVQNERVASLEEELAALQQDYDFLKRQRQVRRPTEPLE
ncbi:hypothetical protein I588_04124 [Enterococcus pallens ATCC BAA-351]|uniref:Uncharacterized protein n=2 Tax=Enterococcus pallens TaxID=160454 RepID=R2Q0V8_9ENTE|nr:hypothetical protein UAU_04031 [Enterococcus pallens ATCC BAA-351]EOU15192.1 hypothetical protein I588_04124 [Enterococcus pallens ATCC BAA-351]OJG79076.1 hypothetical protein RV10_GL000909 [Enterococcus pallens]